MPVLADQAQILRSIQRDKDAIRQIQEDIKDVVNDMLESKSGAHSYLRSLHPVFAQFCYYYCTTLSRYQTLGEEYVGIVLSRAKLSSPSRFNLLCMVTLRILGPHIVPYVLKLWDKSIKDTNNSRSEEDLLHCARKIFIIKETVNILQIVRNGVFYLTGSLYDIAMWVTGIQYLLIQPWLRDEKVSHYFRILGIITMIHSLIAAIDKWRKLQKVCGEDFRVEAIAENADSSVYCYLCMEKRKNTSATPCGHLFCWNCIVDAVRVKNVCPLCREKVTPSRIVILKNYDY